MKKSNMKTVTLATALMLLLSLPFAAFAQYEENRGLFGRGRSSADYDYSGNREGEGGVTIGNMQNDNPTPLGSGLLIMLGAGIGYFALKKTKED